MRISDGSSDVCYSDLRSIFFDNPGFHDLEDSACSIAGAGCHFYMPACSIVSSVMIRATFPCSGLKFYGSPCQPEFCDWAFNLPIGPSLKEKWERIPDDTGGVRIDRKSTRLNSSH